MSRFWSDTVHRLRPYVPGEQPKLDKLIKLNTNECPYGPSPKVVAAIEAELADSLSLYPDPNADELRQCLAHKFSLSADQVFVGNGSDEVLAHTFNALLQHAKPVLFADITYSFYPVYCRLYNIATRIIPLAEDFSLNTGDYLGDNQSGENGGIVIANPNAPTGRLLELDQIEAVLKANPNSVVVVDEAYIDFGGQSAAGLIPQYDNLLVVQTLSKSRSLAGLRVGFALGQAHLIEGLERVKNSFNSYPLARLSLSGAVAALEDEDYFQEVCAKVIATRESLTRDLQDLDFNVLPSKANFVFTTHPTQSAERLAAELRQRHIVVRYFKQPRIDNFLRISIGTDAESEALISALREILGNP